MVNFKKLRQMIEVNGNGNIVSKEIEVSTFIRLHLGCKGVIELHQSDEEKVCIEADENLMEYCTAVNAGRTLYVATEGNIRQPVFTKCVVKVFFNQLNFLYVRNDGGNVVCHNQLVFTQPLEIKVQTTGDTTLDLIVPSLKLLNQAHGKTTLKGTCEKLDIKNQAFGDLDTSALETGELSIKNMAHGNVLLHADSSIKIAHYGNGFIHYTGNAVVKDVQQFGNGEIKRMKSKVTS
ncbi:MAG: GIN domain-containing protein [Bacteroidia bacterium]